MLEYGKFITLEGIEGAGKSTHVAFIKDYLIKQGHKVLTTREPGGTPAAENIREVLLHHWDESISSNTELLLMFAGRAQHIQEVILPALKRGEWVICDRFTDASYAYQGYGRNIDLSHIHYLESWIQQGLKPDITLLFDVPVEVGLKRAAARKAADRIEKEKEIFFERVRKGYLALAKSDSQRIRVIDASQPLDIVETSIINLLAKHEITARVHS